MSRARAYGYVTVPAHTVVNQTCAAQIHMGYFVGFEFMYRV